MKINPKKRLGQNFLNDSTVIEKIIQVSEITQDEDVLEVGPGRGALTRHLLSNSKSVLAYELDSDLIDLLENSLPQKKLTLLNENFLKADLN
jgi:16S rRNA (adenine1518-N6/adenine1519-N6)-dimethyltransferase